jgi:hypothetical protein
MKTYRFTLVFSGISELTSELAHALCAATDGDIELSLRGGFAMVEFERNATTLRAAVTAAIRAVEGARLGMRRVRIESESETATVIAKINADLLGVASG